MKRQLLILTCALTVLFWVGLSSKAQTKKGEPPLEEGSKKSKIVAVNTNELEAFPYDAGKVKFIASSEDTNGAWAVAELTEKPCYKTTWHRHDDLEEAYYVLEGVWTVQLADNVYEFPAGSYVLIPRGMPHGQGNFTDKPVRLLLTVTPGGFERFFGDRVELFKAKEGDKAELQKKLEALRRKYIQIIDYTWDITKKCRQ